MIQEYLNAQFIATTEDSNFDKLQASSEQVFTLLNDDKLKISTYTLTALDPSIGADDPVIKEVQGTIIENWRTFIANSKDTALTIIRAVILEALSKLSADDDIAHIIWFAGRNVLKHYKLGREQEILSTFILGIGNKIQQNVVESWSFSPEQYIEIPEIESAIVSKADLEVQLKAAVLPKDMGGENTSNAAIADAVWGTFFSVRASKGIQDVLNKSFRKQAAEFKKNQQTFYYNANLMQMRTQLLWWKEAGYSTTIDDSYRTLKDGALPLILAQDYSDFVPTLYPSSVDYFLKEVHNSLSGQDATTKKLSEIVTLVEQEKETLNRFVPDEGLKGGRISLLSFLRGLVHEHFQAKQFDKLVGVSGQSQISLAELTVWLFHDLTSLKLLK